MRHGALRYGRAAIVAAKLPHLDKEAICRETASSLLPFFHLPTLCGLSRITDMTCASYKPRLLTSFISGQMEACTGIHIFTVLVGQLRERVLLWYVLIPLAVDKEAITSSSLNHF
jgi:hypothetical protein